MRLDQFFPKEVISAVPRVTMTGREQVHIEQHRGLVGYEQERVVFRTECGLLTIVGEGMRFEVYSLQEAVLAGKVTGVSLTEGD